MGCTEILEILVKTSHTASNIWKQPYCLAIFDICQVAILVFGHCNLYAGTMEISCWKLFLTDVCKLYIENFAILLFETQALDERVILQHVHINVRVVYSQVLLLYVYVKMS